MPVDWSVKLTVSGEQPDVTLAVKPATGFCPMAKVVPVRTITKTKIVLVRVVYKIVLRVLNLNHGAIQGQSNLQKLFLRMGKPKSYG